MTRRAATDGGGQADVSKPRGYTLEDVRQSYTPAKRWTEMQGDLPCFLLYRPLSIRVTPLFLLLGIPATAVTFLVLILSLAMPVVAWWGGQYAFVGLAALAVCVHVLDCVDGNVARTTGHSSRTGALLDGFCDLLFWTLYFASMGILVQRSSPGPVGQHGLEIALALVILVLLHRQLRDSYAREFAERADFAPYPPPPLTFWSVARMCLVGLESLYAFAILLAGAFGALDTLLIAIAVYVVVIFLGAVGLTFREAVRRDAATQP